jgi:hypothetical protein
VPYILAAKFTDGTMGICEYPMLVPDYHNNRKVSFNIIDQTEWVQGRLVFRQVSRGGMPSYLGRSNYYRDDQKQEIDLNDPSSYTGTSFYKIELVWQTSYGEVRKVVERS